LQNFVTRDLKVKYRGSLAGYLWSLLEPLSLVGIYYFVFVIIAQRGEADYPLVVILGVLPFNFFGGVISASAGTLRANAALVRRVHLPRQVYVLASLCSGVVVLFLNMLVVIPFMVIYDVAPSWQLILWPASIILLGIFATGIGLLVACANVIYRDVQYLITVLLRIGFYLSAVIFPVEMVPERFRYFFLFNPFALALAMARNSVLGRPMPFALEHVISAVVLAIGTYLLGAALFPKWERRAVKFL
jgi:ABC-type polysaccharide/polyol phosphate export permease